jgi:hypothetical protein
VKQRLRLKPGGVGPVCLLIWLWLMKGAALNAAPVLDTSSPISFFTNTANLFLQNAGHGFTVTNIPIYPVNSYTPSVHRLLQLAANIYDATTNRTFDDGSSPNGPFYPSVFRPTFGVSGSNIFINGYVEEGAGTTNYQVLPLSLPEDLALVSTNTINIYGIPWVIGARKGFPNFNEFSLQSVAQTTRKIQVVFDFQTNVQYTIGVSNLLGVEAWNSYLAAYPRAVQCLGIVSTTSVLTNELGILVSNATQQAWDLAIPTNQWAGFSGSANQSIVAQSFKIPLLSNTIFLTDSVYRPYSLPHFNANTNFDAGLPYTPLFGLNSTNRLQFVMVDLPTGRVIDYVSLAGMNYSRNLTGELQAFSYSGGDGGVWFTNLVGGNLEGVQRQMAISEGQGALFGFSTNDWIIDSLTGNSMINAITAFNAFMAGGGSNRIMQAPFTPTAKVSCYCTWQANDPLVHYTLADLTPLPPVATNEKISYLIPLAATNLSLSNIAQVNSHYLPWALIYSEESIKDPINFANPAVKDPQVTRSDDWNFSSGQPFNFNWLGRIHRGTPWQTIYLKSLPVDLTNWQNWTGDTLTSFLSGGNAAIVPDALLSEPTNDWILAGLLLPLLSPQDPHRLYSINQTDPNAWGAVFQGLTVLSNASGSLVPLVIDATTNSAAISQIVACINAQRASQPCGHFTNVAQLLAVPQLSLASPFLNTNTPDFNSVLNDAAYESVPSQLLPLLRPDPVGSVASTGQVPQFQFTGFDGYAYNVQSSSNLLDWKPLLTQYPTNGAFIFSDPDATNFNQRYYRAALAP